MDIFYLKKSEFLPFISIDSLNFLDDGKKYKSQNKKIEHLCGLFLTKFIAKNFYEISNTGIEIIERKPYFISREIYFSISHSNDIILTTFNSTNIGADVEYMRERDFKSIMERCGEDVVNPTKNCFYRFWTMKEAEYKLAGEIRSVFSKILENEYMFTCVSDDILVSNFNIKKLSCAGENIDVQDELKSPQKFRLL